MIGFLVVLLVVVASVLFIFGRQALSDRNGRYKRMLENTSRLERELFPEWFPSPPLPAAEEIEFGPGRVWNLSPAAYSYSCASASFNYVQVIRDPQMYSGAVNNASKRAVERLLLFGPQFHG